MLKQTSSPRSLVLSLLCAAMALGAAGCRPYCGAREATPEQVCSFHLETLGIATKRYREEHGGLPPASCQLEGHEHSWRALLAPYVLARADDKTFDYRFSESWDSDHNRGAVRNSHLCGLCMYTCPFESRTCYYPFVSYVMLVRPPVIDPHTGRPSMVVLPDDAVLFVESAHCDIRYGEPRDLNWETLWVGESPFGPGKLNSLHNGVVKVVRVDGKVSDIPKSIGNAALRKLLEGTPKN